MEMLGKIVMWVILVVTALSIMYILFGSGGLFGKTEGSTDELKSYIPKLTEGAENLEAQKITLPSDRQSEVTNFRNALEKITKSTTKNCFAKYGGFAPLGEKGTSLNINYDSTTDETHVLVYGGAGGRQIVTASSFKIKGMKPCIIAGNSVVTNNFVNGLLKNTNVWSEKVNNVDGNHFLPINGLSISYTTTNGRGIIGGATCTDGNILRVGQFGTNQNPVNDECNNFQDNGYLYSPDNKYICFFATNAILGADDDGIRASYLSGTVPILLNGGSLKSCY